MPHWYKPPSFFMLSAMPVPLSVPFGSADLSLVNNNVITHLEDSTVNYIPCHPVLTGTYTMAYDWHRYTTWTLIDGACKPHFYRAGRRGIRQAEQAQ